MSILMAFPSGRSEPDGDALSVGAVRLAVSART